MLLGIQLLCHEVGLTDLACTFILEINDNICKASNIVLDIDYLNKFSMFWRVRLLHICATINISNIILCTESFNFK